MPLVTISGVGRISRREAGVTPESFGKSDRRSRKDGGTFWEPKIKRRRAAAEGKADINPRFQAVFRVAFSGNGGTKRSQAKRLLYSLFVRLMRILLLAVRDVKRKLEFKN
jgi:hypothetical protein